MRLRSISKRRTKSILCYVKLCLPAASSLRQATDDYIKTQEFINADLSPAAAKLAYESRKRRRENLKRHGAVEVESMDKANDEYTPSGSGLNQQPTDNSSNVTTTVNTMSYGNAGTVNPVITAIPSASGVLHSALSSNRPADSSTMRAVDLPTDGLLASSGCQQASHKQPFQ